jgi:hypothetical protein
MAVIYKHLSQVAQDMTAFVLGLKDGQENEAKQLEQGGNANEKRTLQ